MSKNILEDNDTSRAINDYVDSVIEENKELSFDVLIDNVYNSVGVEAASVLVILRGIIEEATDQIGALNDRLSGTGFMVDSLKHAVLNKGLINKGDLEFAVAQVKFIGEILEQEETRKMLSDGDFNPDVIVEKARKMASMLLEENISSVKDSNGDSNE